MGLILAGSFSSCSRVPTWRWTQASATSPRFFQKIKKKLQKINKHPRGGCDGVEPHRARRDVRAHSCRSHYPRLCDDHHTGMMTDHRYIQYRPFDQPPVNNFKKRTHVQVFYALVCMLGLLGNSLVIYVVLRFSKMHTVQQLFIKIIFCL